MFKRKFYDEMLEWKNRDQGASACLLKVLDVLVKARLRKRSPNVSMTRIWQSTFPKRLRKCLISFVSIGRILKPFSLTCLPTMK